LKEKNSKAKGDELKVVLAEFLTLNFVNLFLCMYYMAYIHHYNYNRSSAQVVA
jgi:hypothetical protein